MEKRSSRYLWYALYNTAKYVYYWNLIFVAYQILLPHFFMSNHFMPRINTNQHTNKHHYRTILMPFHMTHFPHLFLSQNPFFTMRILFHINWTKAFNPPISSCHVFFSLLLYKFPHHP